MDFEGRHVSFSGEYTSMIQEPIGSMYGIYTYIWLIFMVSVANYTIRGKKWWDLPVFPWPTAEPTAQLKKGHGDLQRIVLVPFHWVARCREHSGNTQHLGRLKCWNDDLDRPCQVYCQKMRKVFGRFYMIYEFYDLCTTYFFFCWCLREGAGSVHQSATGGSF